jgi:hypothetical protein
MKQCALYLFMILPNLKGNHSYALELLVDLLA